MCPLSNNILRPVGGPAMHGACKTQATTRRHASIFTNDIFSSNQKNQWWLTKDKIVSSFSKSTNQMSCQTCRQNYSTASYGVLWLVVSRHFCCYCRNRNLFIIADTAEIIMADFFTRTSVSLLRTIISLWGAQSAQSDALHTNLTSAMKLNFY